MKRWLLCSATTTALAGFALCGGCTSTNHYHEREVVSATLEVMVQGQWMLVQRETYSYGARMDLNTMSLEDLNRLIREAESEAKTEHDWSRVAALRLALECRKAGVPIQEDK